MVTGFSHQVQNFDDYISVHYTKHLNDAKRTCWLDPDAQDHLNNNVIKVRNRIIKSGFTGNNFGGYLWMGISNDHRLKKKREARKTFYDFNQPEIQNEIQEYLEGEDHDSQLYQDDLKLFTEYVFRYIEIKYPEHNILFKTYYLTKINSYKKLATYFNYQEQSVRNIIQVMKEDVKVNVINYMRCELAPEQWRPVKHYYGYFVSNKRRVKKEKLILKPLMKYKGEVYSLTNHIHTKCKSIEQLLEGVWNESELIIYQEK